MEDSLGVLNINNATLRVGKLQVSDIQGVDTALNVTKSNSVLVYDDQHTATTFNGILGGSATRDTTNNYLNLTQGSVYWGIKLPNAWVMEFHINIRSGTNAGPLLVNTYSTTFTGAQGYSFIFDDSGDKITIKYGSTQLASQVVSGLFTSSDQFQKVTIHYERGRINISLDGVHKLYFTDVERSIPYTTGEYINMSSTSADVRQVKNLKITNSDKWTYSGHSNVVFTQGSVGIGLADPSEKLHVAGTIKAVDFKGDGTTLSGVAKNTDITTIRSEMAANTLTLRNDLQSNVGIIRSEMAANTVAMQSNLSDNSSRITALESTTMSIGGVKTFTNDVIIESNLAVHGNVLVANTQHLIVSDPIIELGANNQNANDLGIVMSRHNHGTNDSNVAIIYDESAKELTFGYTLKNANSHIIPIQASDILTTNICGSLRTTSNLIVDTDTIYVDATNDRVGINKTPTTALDVSGVATFDNDLIVDTDTLHVDVSSDRVGINKLTPDASLHVDGNAYVSTDFSHGGLLPTSGTEIDQIQKIDKTLTIGTTWMDTGIRGTDLATGSYIVQLFSNEQGSHNWSEYYTGFMSWYASSTNSVSEDSSEIVLHAAGHDTGDNHTYLRVQRVANTANPNTLKLQIRKDAAVGTQITYEFRFRRMI